MSLSVILLSNTIDDSIYEMNCDCIESLILSENWGSNTINLEIFLIESRKNNPYQYENRVKVIIPEESFNFHQYLNIGIRSSESKYIALCNNDIIFEPQWFSEILKVKTLRPDLLSFSPIDRSYGTMSYDLFPETKSYYIGWDNKYHFAAWCFVVERKIFDIIGPLDESFDFYSADDDFLMTLRKFALDNALVTNSHVKHLSQVVTKKIDALISPKILDKSKFPIPEKYLRRGHDWLWEDKRFYEAFFKMEKKWGDEKMIRRVNRFLARYLILRKRFVTKLLYSKVGNTILAKLTGV